MNLTTVKRLYLLNRALYKSDFKLKYFNLLFTIYLLQPARITKIDATLTRVKRRHNWGQLKGYLKYLLDNNYITQDNKKYTVTPAGLSILKDIENRLRKERHDK